MFFSSSNSELISKTLDGLHKRHEAILSNVANAETPGYKKQVVEFEEQLKKAYQNKSSGTNNTDAEQVDPTELKLSNPFHLNKDGLNASQAGSIDAERSQIQYRLDQNGVDIEAEMVELAKNSERFQALTRLQFRQFDEIKTILRSER